MLAVLCTPRSSGFSAKTSTASSCFMAAFSLPTSSALLHTAVDDSHLSSAAALPAPPAAAAAPAIEEPTQLPPPMLPHSDRALVAAAAPAGAAWPAGSADGWAVVAPVRRCSLWISCWRRVAASALLRALAELMELQHGAGSNTRTHSNGGSGGLTVWED